MENADNKPSKSKRDTFSERLRTKYPEKSFDNEDDFFGQINEDYDAYDNQLSGYKQREKELSDMFTSDPRSAGFLTNWRRGQDPVVQFVRQFGSEIKDAIDDPEKQEEIAAANKEFVERVAKEKGLEEEYQTNLAKSLDDLSKMQEENGLTDEEIDDAMQLIAGIASDFIVGRITPETMQLAFKAINHDVDVEQAGMEGEIRGKNGKIEEKLRKKDKGDGTADLNGKNHNARSQKQMPSLGALDNYGDNTQNIWERGGEKRRRVNQ